MMKLKIVAALLVGFGGVALADPPSTTVVVDPNPPGETTTTTVHHYPPNTVKVVTHEEGHHGFVHNGFLIESRLAVGAPVFGVATGAFVAPTVAFGFRLGGRLQLSLAASYFHVGAFATTPGTGNSLDSFHFAPTLALDVFKSHDNRAAFYVKAGVPLGGLITTGGPNLFVVGFDASLGGRYSIHRNVALGMEAGCLGLFYGPEKPTTVDVISFYGALVGTFYFGS